MEREKWRLTVRICRDKILDQVSTDIGHLLVSTVCDVLMRRIIVILRTRTGMDVARGHRVREKRATERRRRVLELESSKLQVKKAAID